MRISIAAFSFFFIFFIVNSCKNANNDNSCKFNIDLTYAENNLVDTSILESIQYLPLKSDFIIGGVDKIIYFNKRFYIQDRVFSKTVSVFDERGELVSVLNKIGKGPGEYISMQDFYVDNEGNINILDNIRQRIVVYSYLSAFVKDIKINFNCLNVSSVNKETLCLYRTFNNGILNEVLSLYDLGSNKIKPMINPRTNIDRYNSPVLTKNHLYKSGNSILFNNYFSGIIYSIDDNQINPYCKVIRNEITDDEQKFLSSDYKKMTEESFKKSLLLHDIFETSNYLTFNFKNNGTIFTFFSKKTNRVIFARTFFDKRYYGKLAPQCIKDDEFVSYMNPTEFYGNEKFWNIFLNNDNIRILNKEYLSKNKSNANIVLIFYKLKSF